MIKLIELSDPSLQKALAAGHLWYSWGHGKFVHQCRRDMRLPNLRKFMKQGRLLYGEGK